MQDILEYSGFACKSFGHGREALAWSESEEAEVALVDLRLSDISGLDVISELKKRLPDIECLLVTGYASQTSAIAAINAGVYAYIQKPYDIPQLLITLQRALEKRAAARSLRESEARFRSLAESTATAIFVYSGEKFIYVNRATEELSGYSAQELLAMNFWDVVHPDFREVVRQRGLARQSGEQVPPRYEFKIVRKDGEERWVDFTAGRIEWQSQPATIGTAFDITERKQAEESLRRQEEDYRKLFEDHAAVKLIIDADTGDIVDANHAAAAYYGWSREELRRMRIQQINTLPPEQVKQEMERARRLQRIHFEFRHRRADGSIRDVSVFSSRVSWKGKDCLYSIIHDISAQKQAESQLILQNTALEASANAIVIANREGFIKWANPAFTALTGYKVPQEVFGRNPRDLVKSGKQDQRFYKDLWDTILSGRVWRGTLINRRKDGSLYDEEMTITPVKNESGEITHFIAVKQDISPRKRWERELLESEARYAALVETSPAGIFRTDAEGKTTYVSRRWCEISGLDGKTALGDGWLAAVHPEDRQALADGWQQASLHGQPSAAEYRFIRPDGSVRWVRGQAVPETDNQGIVIGYVGAITDVTEERLAAQAIQVSEARYRGLFEDSPVSLWEEDFSQVKKRLEALRAAGVQDFRAYFAEHPEFVRQCAQEVRILDVNRTTLHLYRASNKEALLEQLNRVFGKESYLAFAEELAHIAQGETAFQWEGVNYTLDGQRLEISLHWLAMPGHEGDLSHVLISIVDITERKRSEAELRRRAEEFAALYETARDLAAQSELLPILHSITQHACSLLHAASGNVYLYDPQRGDLELTISTTPLLPTGSRLLLGQGMAGRVAQSGQPLIVDDYRTWESRAPQYKDIPFRAVIQAPMLDQQTLIGVLSVAELGDSERKFSQEDLHLLTLFAHQAALAVSKARLYEETRQQLAELEMLYENSLHLNRLLRPEEIARKMIEIMGKKMAWHHATIRMLDETHSTLRVLALARGGQLAGPEEIARLEQAATRPGEGLSGWVVAHGEVIRSGDVRADPRYRQTFAEICSGLYVPIRAGDRIIGSIAVESEQENAFSEADERLLITLALQAGIAFENARLFERTRQHAENLKAIQAMGRGLAETFDLAAIYEQVRQSIFALLPEISGVMINLFDSEKQLITPAYCYTDDAVQDVSALPPIPLAPPGEGTQSRAIHSRQPVVINHFQEQLKKARLHLTVGQAEPPRRSSMYVPMLTQGKVVGLIIVQSPVEERFSDADVELTSLIANTAAVAIENARLFEEIRHRIDEMAVVNALGRALAETLDIRTIFLAAYEHIRHLFDCPNFAISLFDSHRQEIRLGFLISDGEEMDVSAVPPLPFDPQDASSGRARAIAAATVEIVNNLGDKARQGKTLTVGSQLQPESAIYVPMVVEGAVLGLVELQSYRAEAYTAADSQVLSMLANQIGLTIANARLFAEARRHAAQMATVNEIGRTLAETLDLQQIYQQLGKALWALLPDICCVLISRYNAQTQTFGYVYGQVNEQALPAEDLPLLPLDSAAQSQAVRQALPHIVNKPPAQAAADSVSARLCQENSAKSALYAPMLARGEAIGVLQVQSDTPNRFTPADGDLLALVANTAAISMENSRLLVAVQQELAERKRAEQTLEQRLKELLAVNRVSTALRSARNLSEMLPILLDETLAAVGAEAGIIWLYNPASGLLEEAISKGWFTQLKELRIRPGEGISGSVYTSGQVYISPLLDQDAALLPEARPLVPPGWSGACAPIRTTQETVGVLFASTKLPRQLTPADVEVLITLCEIAGNAIHRTRLHEQTERQVQRLAALHAIDTTISASTDLRLTLNILLDQVLTHLHADAAAILMTQPNSTTLTYCAGRGFRSHGIVNSYLRLGKGIAGRAALERRIISVPELQTVRPAQPERLAGEGFVSMFVAPLVAKGQVKGVLEIFTRSPLVPDQEWLEFLETLAGQAAIAIDNSLLFNDLQNANVKLSLAYDATIEGWSRAMDLRDHETEGHSQRVTQLTLDIARQMGISEAKLVHIRRGALLHDLGKLGVPDHILFKAGKLSDEEWEIMRKHPVYAYEMLLPIEYLHPALDIPYCHHEKWDGSGYPRGLKGEQIPLAARIFAVADVWDALISDRPYRKAWQPRDALAYIQSQAGRHFDPRVVQVFVEWMSDRLEK